MRSLLPRALSAGRQSVAIATPMRTTLCERLPSFNFTQAALASTKPRISRKPKTSQQPVNPNIKDKVPPQARILQRAFIAPPTKTPEELAALPYIVRRTPYSQLPIYRSWKSGGNRVIILIKKVDGDRLRMVDELGTALQLERQDIRLNPTTQHIEIKGDHFEKALSWLLAAGY